MNLSPKEELKLKLTGGGGSIHGDARGYGAGLGLDATAPVSPDMSLGISLAGNMYDVKGDWGRSRDADLTNKSVSVRKSFAAGGLVSDEPGPSVSDDMISGLLDRAAQKYMQQFAPRPV